MSPLELFRRNQKFMMTGLILLAMFAFVVLPAISTSMRQNGPGMTDPVLAELDGVRLTASRINVFTQQHYSTVQFLRKLAQETIRRGGTPQVPGFNIDQRSGEIQGVGINGQPSEGNSIRTLQFAAAAEAEGFELDDTAVDLWLEQFTGGTMSDRDMFALLRKESNNRMGQIQLYNMLRKQLLSSLYFRAASSTVASGQRPIQSPLDHWKNFLKLNQKASIHAYAVMVNDFIERTDEAPGEAEILTVYNDGKDRYPSEQSAEPGFRRRDTAKFEYLMADLDQFRRDEVAKLSEEEIRAEYDRRVSGGDFVLPDVSLPDLADDPEEAPEDEEATDAKDTGASPSGDGEASEMKENEDQSEEKPQGDSSEPEEATKTKPQQEEQQRQQVEEFAKELDQAGDLGAESPAESEPETTKTSDQSSITRSGQVRLVAMQSDVETESDETSGAAEVETETSAEEKPDGVAADGDASDGGTEPEDSDVSEQNEGEESGATAESKDGKPAMESESDAKDGDEPKETKVQAFEDVREQIANSMVEKDARIALDKAITAARNSDARLFSKTGRLRRRPKHVGRRTNATGSETARRRLGPDPSGNRSA